MQFSCQWQAASYLEDSRSGLVESEQPLDMDLIGLVNHPITYNFVNLNPITIGNT